MHQLYQMYHAYGSMVNLGAICYISNWKRSIQKCNFTAPFCTHKFFCNSMVQKEFSKRWGIHKWPWDKNGDYFLFYTSAIFCLSFYVKMKITILFVSWVSAGINQEPVIPAFSIPILILRLFLRLVDFDTDTDTRKSENFDSDSDTDTKVKQVLLHRF